MQDLSFKMPLPDSKFENFYLEIRKKCAEQMGISEPLLLVKKKPEFSSARFHMESTKARLEVQQEHFYKCMVLPYQKMIMRHLLDPSSLTREDFESDQDYADHVVRNAL